MKVFGQTIYNGGVMWYLVSIAIIVGILLTINDVYHDIDKYGRLTLNLPITATMHVLLGVPMLTIFMIVAVYNELIKRGD